MATTYSIPLSKRQTYRIRQLVAHDEWDSQSEDRMIIEIIDHGTDITYVLLAGDAVFSPPHPNMRDLKRNNRPFTDRSPVIHTTLARPGYSWPPWPCVRNDRNFCRTPHFLSQTCTRTAGHPPLNPASNVTNLYYTTIRRRRRCSR